MKEFIGSHAGRASRDRLARVRTRTTPTGGHSASGSLSVDESSKTIQVGSPFATLFLLCRGRHQPPKYGIGVLVVTEPPAAGSDNGNGEVVKGRLMQLVSGGDGSVLEWEMRKLHMAHTYSCSLPLVIELDPNLEVEKKTYVFSMSELATTLAVLQETVESFQGWDAVPVMRKPPCGKVAPLPLHDDLTCMSGEVVGSEAVLAAAVGGKVSCPLCPSDVNPKQMLQHMGGHILENEVISFHVQAFISCWCVLKYGGPISGVSVKHVCCFRTRCCQDIDSC